jgi:hypothetical protein
MTRPPASLDGALILRFAELRGAMSTGRTRHVVDGGELERIAALAIARYGEEPGVYLFYCDANWRVLTDTMHETEEAAVEQARFEYDGVAFVRTQT